MYLSAMLICLNTGLCLFKTLEPVYPNKFACEETIKDGEDYFNSLPNIDYAEGRCILWGNLIGEEES